MQWPKGDSLDRHETALSFSLFHVAEIKETVWNKSRGHLSRSKFI